MPSSGKKLRKLDKRRRRRETEGDGSFCVSKRRRPDNDSNEDSGAREAVTHDHVKQKKQKKQKSHKSQRSPRQEETSARLEANSGQSSQPADEAAAPRSTSRTSSIGTGSSDDSTQYHKYILAPMVGASELAFRLLCRNYGATLAYTPMMSARDFVRSGPDSCGFQTCPADAPLVCHFSANDPEDFAAAVRVCAGINSCVAVDLNLGCPQRTAYLGHFGSYLLGEADRDLICSIVRAGAAAAGERPRPSGAATPRLQIFCKIRLLDTLSDTVQLCRQLAEAGAVLIAVHARYRASWDRKGPGARDGPALLEQVAVIRKALPSSVAVVANGNVKGYGCVVKNLASTRADGIMSAEGLLDDPSLFLPRYGSLIKDGDTKIIVKTVVKGTDGHSKRKRQLLKRLQSIDKTERKLHLGKPVSDEKMEKLRTKDTLLAELKKMTLISANGERGDKIAAKIVSLRELYERSNDKILLAREYLSFVRVFPVTMRSAIFHIRRILKGPLTQYQLMEECLTCDSVEQVEVVLGKIEGYRAHPESFVFDRLKAQQEKEALERKQREEGKRKAYEERMIRKAKREGQSDLNYYLNIGAAVPTVEEIELLKLLDKEAQMAKWKVDHSQHCLNFHLNPQGCQRDRSCAFLHVSAQGANAFIETDEVAG